MTTETTGLEVAIIGMAVRVAGATDLDAYWQLIVKGEEHISRFSEADLLAEGVPLDLLRDPNYVPAKPVLPRGNSFDAEAFGFTRHEAERLDPKTRVFHEVALHALEHAGYAGNPSVSVGVFAGASEDPEWLRRIAMSPSGDAGEVLVHGPLFHKDFLAQHLAYRLNLRGPAVSIYTACSTSLAAVSMACRSLLVGDCELALAGGVTVELPLRSGYRWRPGLIHARDGRCRPFDASATGTVFGDGAAAVVLKRLDDAIADRDSIHAVLVGSALNNDGRFKAGFVTPGVEGQSEVIRAALAMAGLTGEDIGYVEAHGTGTPVGDPVEFVALTRAFATNRRGFCALGSVKANIGHTHAAAGLAGLIKAALIVREGVIPPLAAFERPNPRLSMEDSPFWIPRAATPWPESRPLRYAGVSSFGIGGTNVHAIVRVPPRRDAQQTCDESGPFVVPLSAHTMVALDAAERALSPRLVSADASELASLAFTHQVGRREMSVRRAMRVTAGPSSNSVRRIDIAEGASGSADAALCLLIRLDSPPLSDLSLAMKELSATIDPLTLARAQAGSQEELVQRAGAGDAITRACVAYTLCAALREHLPGLTAATGVGQGLLVAAALSGVMEWGAVLEWLAGGQVRAPLPPRRASPLGRASAPTDALWTELVRLDDAGWHAQMHKEHASRVPAPVRWLSPLDPPSGGWRETLAALWLAGHRVDWRRFYPSVGPGRVPSVLTSFADTAIPLPGTPGVTTADPKTTAPARPRILRQRRPDMTSAYRAPELDPERTVIGFIEELLEVAPIGMDDDFFELGGDSLAATRLSRRLEERFGALIDLASLLDQPTPARIVDRILALEPARSRADHGSSATNEEFEEKKEC